MTDFFDATQIQPQQGGGTSHPVGMFDAFISNTFAKPTKDGSGGRFIVEVTTPAGKVENGYNIWNQSPQAVEIANKELSALCHATGVFKISFPKDANGNQVMAMAGAELRNARLRIEVGPQTRKNSEGKQEETGYTEIKRVFDVNGNEPGKPATAAPSNQANGFNQPAQQQPQQQQPQGQGWGPAPGTAAPQPQSAPQAAPQGWGQPQPQQQQPAPNPAPQQQQPAPQGWQQGPQGVPTGAEGRPSWAGGNR